MIDDRSTWIPPTEDLTRKQWYLIAWPNKAKRHYARVAVRTAVARGKIIKPTSCSSCLSEVPRSRDLHAHHDDYDKPLEIRWLCRRCHGEYHRRVA